MTSKRTTKKGQKEASESKDNGASVVLGKGRGRPPIFTSPEEMEIVIEAYFTECDAKKQPYTVAGLALALGMCRDTLCEYEKHGGFSDTVKKAKQRVEADVEARLLNGGGAGCIFWMKNNAGYKDKQDVEHSGSVEVSRIERIVVEPKDSQN